VPDQTLHMAAVAATTDIPEVRDLSSTYSGSSSDSSTSGFTAQPGQTAVPSTGPPQHAPLTAAPPLHGHSYMALNQADTPEIPSPGSAHIPQGHVFTFAMPLQNAPPNGALLSQQHFLPSLSLSGAPVNVSTLRAPSPQMSETDRNVCSVGRNLPVNNSTHTVQPMDTSTVCAKHINISTCAPQANSDETSVKSTECDSGNPLLTDKLASHGRSRVVRSETRSQRRASSAVPYRRQASKSKSSAQRVLPVTKNSEPCLSGAQIAQVCKMTLQYM